MRLGASFVLFTLLMSLAQVGLAQVDNNRMDQATDVVSGFVMASSHRDIVSRVAKQDIIERIYNVKMIVTRVHKGRNFPLGAPASFYYRRVLDCPAGWQNKGQPSVIKMASPVTTYLVFEEPSHSFWLIEPNGFDRLFP